MYYYRIEIIMKTLTIKSVLTLASISSSINAIVNLGIKDIKVCEKTVRIFTELGDKNYYVVSKSYIEELVMAMQNKTNTTNRILKDMDIVYSKKGGVTVGMDNNIRLIKTDNYMCAIAINVMKEEPKMKVIKIKEGRMTNRNGVINPENYGPQRFCTCHNGVTKTEDELMSEEMEYQDKLDMLNDRLSMLQSDSENETNENEQMVILDDIKDTENEISLVTKLLSKIADDVRDLTGSFTQLEQCEDGFVCPACGAEFHNTDVNTFERFEDISSGYDGMLLNDYDQKDFTREEFMRSTNWMYDAELNYSPDAPVARDFSKKELSLICPEHISTEWWFKNRVAKQFSNAMGSYSQEDFKMLQGVKSMVMKLSDLDKAEVDACGKPVSSLDKVLWKTQDNDDIDNDSVIDEDAVMYHSEFIGNTGISGMLDFRTFDNGDEITIAGIFNRYYKTNHSTMADKITEKAKLAKEVIINSELEQEIKDSYLVKLGNEYNYWMAFASDMEWSVPKKIEFFRSTTIMNAKETGIRYYKVIDDKGMVSFRYEPATWTMTEGREYVNGSMDLMMVGRRDKQEDELFSMIAEKFTTKWTHYNQGSKSYVNVLITDKDMVVTMFAGYATPEMVITLETYFGASMTSNEYNYLKALSIATGVTLNTSWYYFVEGMVKHFDIFAPMSAVVQMPKSKWLTDIKWMGNDIECKVEPKWYNDTKHVIADILYSQDINDIRTGIITRIPAKA